jgi:hypothetical protein
MNQPKKRKKEWEFLQQIGRILLEEQNRNHTLRVLDREERVLRKKHSNVPF